MNKIVCSLHDKDMGYLVMYVDRSCDWTHTVFRVLRLWSVDEGVWSNTATKSSPEVIAKISV